MMKIRYIGETIPFALTKEKEYYVISVEKNWYRIVDDTNEDYLFPPELFEIVEQ